MVNVSCGVSQSKSNSKGFFLKTDILQQSCRQKHMTIEAKETISTPAAASVVQNVLQPSGLLNCTSGHELF